MTIILRGSIKNTRIKFYIIEIGNLFVVTIEDSTQIKNRRIFDNLTDLYASLTRFIDLYAPMRQLPKPGDSGLGVFRYLNQESIKNEQT